MRIKKQKYQPRTLFFRFAGRKDLCRFAAASTGFRKLLMIVFCCIVCLSSIAQTIQPVPNPDAGSTDAFGNASVIYNGNLYIKYQNAAGHVQLAMLNGNALTLIPNPDAGSGINIFDNQAANPFVIYNGNLYFQYQDIAGRFRLAMYNGFAVTLVPNPVGAPGDVGEPDPNFVLYNGDLYFEYYKLAGGGKYQLAQYNGATITLVPNPDGALDPNGYLANPIVYNNNLYLQYQDVSGTGRLAQYNGVSVTLITNPDAGAGVLGLDASGTNTPVIYNNDLYVNYLNAAGISQLGQFDGATLTLVPNPDAVTNPGGTYFDQTPIVYNSKLYFQYINASGNFQIIKYDGTTMTPLSYPPGGAFFSVTSPLPWAIFNNDLFVQYYSGIAYLQLAQYNGVSTSLIADAPGAIQYLGAPIVYNNQLYTDFQNNSSDNQLMQYDGTSTDLIPNVTATDAGYQGYAIVFGTKLYFMYQNAAGADQLAYIADCPTVSVTATDSTICPGTNVTFTVSSIDGGNNPVYQWTVNSAVAQIGGTTYSSASLVNHDTVVCTLTNKPSACSAVAPADSIIMTVNPTPIVTISGDTCQNAVLTATISNPTDTITWLRNGVAVLTQPVSAGTTYTASTTGSYSATVVSAAGCSSPISDTIIVKAPWIPSVTIASNINNVCKDVNITFTATPVNGGATPSYQWKINGVNAGPNSNVFSSTTFNNNDTVSCSMTSSIGCVLPATVISDSIALIVNDSPAVSLSIAASTNNVCFGTPITFSATPVNGGATPSFQWQLNAGNVGSNNSLYTNDTLSNGNTVSCILTSSSACTIPTASNTISMIIYPLPVVTDLPDTTIPVGASAILDLPITGNINHYLWSPANTLSSAIIQNPVATPVVNTTYTLEVTTVDGCTATGQMAVDLFSGLFMPNAFTPNNDGLNDKFRISPSIKIKLDFFSIFDRWGNEVFTTTDPSVGWDGNYTGLPAATATYVWVIQYTDPLTNLPAQSKGTVVLLR